MVKNPPVMRENWVRSLGWEDPLQGWEEELDPFDITTGNVKRAAENSLDSAHDPAVPLLGTHLGETKTSDHRDL